ncbi:hypothetical protein [Egicoccus halophilus]|uniref:hypothetical protein n=1 Tax=Egicoccus halophilus TaxID=1670830 RepID=UPI001032233C|nr:hypothetical protein [Egicoccus halophilus]
MLVLLVLAAIAFDGAAVYLQQRRLADLAASLANDVVAGLDPASLYDTVRDPDIDPGRAADLAHARLAAFGRDRTLQDVHCTPAVDGSQVTVSCEAVVRATFGRALAPDRGTYRVRAVESARAAVS